jgi:feruloyl-CoA synthase
MAATEAPRASVFGPVRVRLERRSDGAMLLTNEVPLGNHPVSLLERLDHWASVHPDRLHLAERNSNATGPLTGVSKPSASAWRALSYAATRAAVQDTAARLLGLELDVARPLLIIAPNGIYHAVLMLAAMRIGVPVSVVSPAAAQEPRRLARVLEVLTPGALFTGHGLDGLAIPAGAPVRSLQRLGIASNRAFGITAVDELPAVEPAAVDAAFKHVCGDTIAKLLFTSGSTGAPKAVITTQRMLCSNAAGLASMWPFLLDEPPTLVDWLPWSHVFGGNCCFDLALHYGGTFYVDDGRPLPNGIDRTVSNLNSVMPNVYFNVPMGYDALVPHLESDPEFARRFFSGVRFLCSAGAALPDRIRQALRTCAMKSIGRAPPIIGAWGSTETAPFATAVCFDTPHADNIGIPVPAVAVKLVPDQGKFELRVKGPNVMPGYWRDPMATAAAFDEDGYYRMGDCGRFADFERPEAGLRFDGRMAENFKLNSGTWVNVGALRLSLIECTKPLIADVVLAGQGRDHVAALLFPALDACREFLGPDFSTAEPGRVIGDSRLIEALRLRLYEHYCRQSGASTRIERFCVTAKPPNPFANEITEKGSLNQRAVLSARALEIEDLYAVGGYSVTGSAADAAWKN